MLRKILICVGIVLVVFMLYGDFNFTGNYSLENSIIVPSPLPNNSINIESTKSTKVNQQKWMRDMELRYLKENQRIKKICKEFNKQAKTIDLRFLKGLWSDSHHGIKACLNPKAGSTTWKFHLYNLLPAEKKRMLEKKFGPPYHRSFTLHYFPLGC